MNQHRGGCIVCMDYGPFAKLEYLQLVPYFEQITTILTTYLAKLKQNGFDMAKGYMFGFSFGGQLVAEAGQRIGNQSLDSVDSGLILNIRKQ